MQVHSLGLLLCLDCAVNALHTVQLAVIISLRCLRSRRFKHTLAGLPRFIVRFRLASSVLMACRVTEYGPGCVIGAVDFFLDRAHTHGAHHHHPLPPFPAATIEPSRAAAAGSQAAVTSTSLPHTSSVVSPLFPSTSCASSSARLLRLSRPGYMHLAATAPAALGLLQALLLRSVCQELSHAGEGGRGQAAS